MTNETLMMRITARNQLMTLIELLDLTDRAVYGWQTYTIPISGHYNVTSGNKLISTFKRAGDTILIEAKAFSIQRVG